MIEEGHAVRVTTRAEAGRAAIEASGAECWVGTPERLGTLRGALENVTIVCWLLATAAGSVQQIQDLHGSRLEFFLFQVIDTTVRGFVYEVPETSALAAGGERIVRVAGERNAIPVAFLRTGLGDPGAWQAEAQAVIASLLAGR